MTLFARLALLWGVTALAPTFAATPSWEASPRFETIADAERIVDGIATVLAQGDSGLIWMGTARGLVRYDGYQLRRYTLGGEAAAAAGNSSFVRSLLVDQRGLLWMGTDSEGLWRFDPVHEVWTQFTHREQDGSSISAGAVRAFALGEGGRIWLGTQGGGLDRLDPATGRFEHVGVAQGLPDTRIYALATDARGALWVGTWSGLARCMPATLRCETVFSHSQGSDLAGEVVSALQVLPDGSVWAGTRRGDLARIDPQGDGRWLSRGERRNDPVFAFWAGRADELWVGRTSGIEVRSRSDGSLRKRLRRDPTRAFGQGGNDVVALLQDRSGWVWFGSYGGGLQRFMVGGAGLGVWRGEDGDTSAETAARSAARTDVHAILQLRNGEIWLGQVDGAIGVLDPQLRPLRTLRLAQQGAGDAAFVGALVQARDGHVWAGVGTALLELDRDGRVLSRYSQGQARIRRLHLTADGSLWIATQEGLFRRTAGGAGAGIERVNGADGTPVHGNFNAMLDADDGALWVGADLGLYRVAKGGSRLEEADAAGQGLPRTPVLGMLRDDAGRIWLDSQGGLVRMHVLPGQGNVYESVAARYGFAGREFGANLLADAQGRIWTQRGVFDPASGSHDELTVADGVDIGTGWFRAYTRLTDGRLLFGGSTGMLVVEPAQFKRWAFKPPVVLTGLRVDGAAVPATPRLVLAPRQRGFSAEFAAMDLSAPARNRYRYRLEDFDADWVEADARLRVAAYGNLAPGQYLLRVQGSNRVGDWSPSELLLEVQVQPRWYETWWARVLQGLLLLAALGGIVHLRTRILQRRQHELERRVQERTAELEKLTQALAEASLVDPLTGLHNRRFLGQHIETDVALALRRHEDPLLHHHGAPPLDADMIFFLIDIDHFKQVNDGLGHAAGDAVLVQVGERLRQVFRDTDHLVRWGGEEFLAVARASTRSHAAELAERVRAAIAGTPFVLADGRQTLQTCSIGYACLPLMPGTPRAQGWEAAVELADAALFDAKRAGRNTWVGATRLNNEQDAAALLRLPLRQWLASGYLNIERPPIV